MLSNTVSFKLSIGVLSYQCLQHHNRTYISTRSPFSGTVLTSSSSIKLSKMSGWDSNKSNYYVVDMTFRSQSLSELIAAYWLECRKPHLWRKLFLFRGNCKSYQGGTYKERPMDKGRGVKQMLTYTSIFACKRSNFADAGERGVKKRPNFADVINVRPVIFIYGVRTSSNTLVFTRYIT